MSDLHADAFTPSGPPTAAHAGEPSDGDLLRRYVTEGSQPAFTTVVQRHLALVYRAALRRVGGNAHAADDVTQKVFTDLARKAPALQDRASLASWLYTSVRFAASDAVRAERRRRTIEAEAETQRAISALDPVAWERLEPWLDEVMDRLPERDREAVLLHFFEGRAFPEVGAMLALSADAARMRVNRALERLRVSLGAKGIASSAAALGEALLSHSASAATLPSATVIATQALSEASALGGFTTAAKVSLGLRAMPWSAGLVAIILVGGATYWGFKETSPVDASPVTIEATAKITTGAPATDGVHLVEEKPDTEEPAAPEPKHVMATGDSSVNREWAPKDGFSGLTGAEKRILKKLWNQHVALGNEAKNGWGVRATPDDPNYQEFIGARRLLRLRGWVRVVGQKAVVMLTDDGIAFCTEQHEEIDAFQLPKTKPGPAVK